MIKENCVKEVNCMACVHLFSQDLLPAITCPFLPNNVRIRIIVLSEKRGVSAVHRRLHYLVGTMSVINYLNRRVSGALVSEQLWFSI